MNLTLSDVITIVCASFPLLFMLFLEWPRVVSRWHESGGAIVRTSAIVATLLAAGFIFLRVYEVHHQLSPVLPYLYRAVFTVAAAFFFAYQQRVVASVTIPGSSLRARGMRGSSVLFFIILAFIGMAPSTRSNLEQCRDYNGQSRSA
jgi:hypothetical protein